MLFTDIPDLQIWGITPKTYSQPLPFTDPIPRRSEVQVDDVGVADLPTTNDGEVVPHMDTTTYVRT